MLLNLPNNRKFSENWMTSISNYRYLSYIALEINPKAHPLKPTKLIFKQL